jgi:HEAT repeat protein
LGRIGDARAIPKLLPLLNDPIWHVRFAAEDALAKLKKGN